ncbi:MAG: hypothetical protein RLZ40_1190 [Actinomycetota bacterium]
MVKRLGRLVANWEVDVERMATNLEQTRGAIYSQSVLLALVEAGFSRDAAYRLVQDATKRAHETRTHLREVLASAPEISAKMSASALDKAFDLRRVLMHASRAIDALNELD